MPSPPPPAPLTQPPVVSPLLQLGDCLLDLAAQRLTRAGAPVPLAPRYFAVLVHLAGSGGRLVTKDELLDAVWGHRSVSDSALKVAINAVRAALGDNPKAPRHVETVSRRGYRFVGAVPLGGAGDAAPTIAAATTGPAAGAQPRLADGSAHAANPANPANPAGLAAAAVATEAPPTDQAPAGNLPPPVPGLIGRDADLARLADALARHRLVTLLGPGGVGKTRLALAGAAVQAPADGVWLLRLDALTDAAPLLATVARTLGLGAGTESTPAALARALAGQRLRLLVDNAEHLLAAVADLAAALLNGAPGVQLLVTSQVPLNLADEHRVLLAPLALPAAAGQAAPSVAPALQLLLARAHQHQPDLAVTADDLADAAAICHALDGLPLALELAAARVPLLGWSAVRARLGERLPTLGGANGQDVDGRDASGLAGASPVALPAGWSDAVALPAGPTPAAADQRFGLLTRGQPGAAPRHRSLHAALAWTHALLSPAEQRLLQGLSVFAGSFDVQTAVAVAADPSGTDYSAGPADATDPIDLLDSLRERSLLVRASDGPATRWRLYDSVRAFAAEGLQASGRWPAVQRRLVLVMTRLFQQADQRFLQQPTRLWVADWQPEVPNLRAAMRHALASPDLAVEAVALFAASVQFRVRGGWRREAGADHAVLLARGLPPLPPLLQADHGLALGQLAALGQVLAPQVALDAVRSAQPVFAAAGALVKQHMAMYLEVALMLRLQASHDSRADLLARMRALEPADWTPLQRRHRIWQDAMLLRDRGDLQAFEAACADYIATGRATGDDTTVWVSAEALAQALAGRGQFDRAAALLVQPLAQMRQAGLLREMAHVLAQWAGLRLLIAPDADALAALQQAARLMQPDGRLWWMADMLAWPAAWQGRWADAVRLQAWADGLVRQRGDRRGPLFSAVRLQFDARLATQPDADRWRPLLDRPPALDEDGILALAFSA